MRGAVQPYMSTYPGGSVFPFSVSAVSLFFAPTLWGVPISLDWGRALFTQRPRRSMASVSKAVPTASLIRYRPTPLPSSIGREPDDRSKLGCGACGGAFSRRRERRTPLGPAPKMVSDAVGRGPTASLMRNYLRNTARGAHKRAQKTPKAAQKPRPLSEAVLTWIIHGSEFRS